MLRFLWFDDVFLDEPNMIECQFILTEDENFTTWRKQFVLFLYENGVWRCGGRLAEADLSYYSKHSILLNRNHPLTALIIKNAHERVGHNGVRETLNEI